jgi:hypothetical protein
MAEEYGYIVSYSEHTRQLAVMKPDELRALKDSGPVATVKLPICEGILTDLRARSWPEGWSDEAKRLKAVYVGTMYGFETAGRIGEFTHCELGNQDRSDSLISLA